MKRWPKLVRCGGAAVATIVALAHAVAVPTDGGTAAGSTTMSTLLTPAPVLAAGAGMPSAESGGSRPEAVLDSAAADMPVSATALPRHATAAPVLDDVPDVAVCDVVSAVVRATGTALPWLHFGPRPQADVAPGRETNLEAVHRATLSSVRREAQEGERSVGQGAGAAPVDLAREALELASDLLFHPLTWILGLPALLAGFVLAMLRQRRK